MHKKAEYEELMTSDSVASRPSLRQEESNLLESDEHTGKVSSENFPESIYGAGMSFILQATSSTHWPVFFLSVLVGLALVLNVALQLFALYCVRIYIAAPAVAETRKLYAEFHYMAFVDGEFDKDAFDDWDQDKKERLCALPFSQPVFTLMILFIWTMAVIIELKDTILFTIWWIQLPRCEHKAASLGKLEGDEDSVVVLSASSRVKAFVISTILIPKLVIALLLWWLGARWLVATTSLQDLILNAMALSFIVDLDEMTFLAIVPHRAKKTLELFKIQVPPPKGDSAMKVYKWMGQMAGKFLIMVTVPLLYMNYFQHVLPDYQFDVSLPCHHWRQENLLDATRAGMHHAPGH